MQDQIDYEKDEARKASREKIERARLALLNRQMCYQDVFNLDKPEHVVVLMDLAKFCRANTSTFHADPRAHALAEGRREVWLRIQQHLKLDLETIWKLYNNGG